jgi:ABC-type spermidine/putrescine transport system permease subunit II
MTKEPTRSSTVRRALLLGLMTLFVVSIGLMIASRDGSFKRWLGTWLPEGWTTQWYTAAWKNSSSTRCCGSPRRSLLAVVLLALLIGVPAAYARRGVPGKRADAAVPAALMVPPITCRFRSQRLSRCSSPDRSTGHPVTDSAAPFVI